MSFAFHVFYSLALGLSLLSPVLAQSQSTSSAPSSTHPNQSSAEAAARAVVEKYFALYAAKDLDGLMSLWSAKSPELEARKKSAAELFASSEKIALKSLAVRQIKLDGEKARVRVEADMQVIEAKTDKEKPGYGKLLRTLEFVQEAGHWKIWSEASTFDELAAALAAAKGEQERAALLAKMQTEERELMTAELVSAVSSRGDRFYEQGDYPQALALHRLAQGLAEQTGDRPGLARTLNNTGKILYAQGNYAQALAQFRQSLALQESLGHKAGVALALNNIGNVHFRQGDYTQALEHYQKSLALSEALGDQPGVARTLGNIGNIHLEQGDPTQALELYQQSLTLLEAQGNKGRVAITLYNMGYVYYDLSNYARAMEHFQKSLTLAGAIGDQEGVAWALNSVGNVYMSQGNYAQSLDYYRQGLALSEKLGDKEGVATMLDNIGLVYNKQGDYAPALEYLRKSLALREEMGNREGIARTLKNLGNVHYNQFDYAPALEYFQKSLALREALGNKNGIAVALSNIAKVHQKQGRQAPALDFAERAAALARQIGETEVLWRARLMSGAAYRALNQPAQARLAFEEAVATVETLRTSVAGGEEEQQRFFASRVSPYHAMVDLFVAEGRATEALAFAERAKARVLLDVLQTGRVNVTKALTTREQEQELKLRAELSSLNTQVSTASRPEKPDQAKLGELKSLREKARLNYEAFQTSLYAAHPELRVHRGEAPVIEAEEVAALLPDAGSALLEYVVTDEVTFLFAVTKGQGKPAAEVQVFTLPVKRDELIKQIEAFRQQLAGRDLGYHASAMKLHALLLKPAQAQLKGKNNLVIVPDDKLWDLPFQALLTRTNRFLIEEAALAYTPSLTVLREMTKRRRKWNVDEASATLLALGNPLLGKETRERATLALRDEKLDPLPEAEEEVKALGQLYSAAGSKVYIGAEAREDRAKTEAGQARILHFATHGTLNNASPMYSHLVLAQGDKNEDGLLEAWELMELDLKADLVVLSACETARGRFGAGEGMIGLTWALFVAGVPATVVSQWKVESASTRDLMVSFHRGISSPPRAGKAKATKTEALRQAALKLLKNPETSHPFYWAGFVLVGDGR